MPKPWGISVLHRAGLRAILQAGNMQWPIVPPEMDDGVSPTHFSYLWTPDEPASVAALAEGRLPEIHVWIALPDTQELVDFSTGSFSRLARERLGLVWQTPEPPPYLWTRHPPALYEPKLSAIHFALSVLLKATQTP